MLLPTAAAAELSADSMSAGHVVALIADISQNPEVKRKKISVVRNILGLFFFSPLFRFGRAWGAGGLDLTMFTISVCLFE